MNVKEFGIFGEGFKSTIGTFGEAPAVNMFSDIVTGNVGAALQDEVKTKKK
ncbi:hypothetical protein [Pinibacter soli]|uniref:Uncharacterized protein n=1 Tax=Pinibacter soli TaxID=3044211 RepID=A0ABT6R921_9BACT|nr:hypothetical protein [Pinibacter soli]MDI3318389.1 hypothetical protein [Pinibacter soli]